MTRRLTIWPPPPRGTYLERPARALPFPLHEPHCRLFSRARHALWAGVRSLGLEPGDEVLAPAYHHGSEIEALVRAGLVCRFYEAHDDLVPEAAELEELIGARTRALLLIHYLGFPQDALRWRRWCDDRGLRLLEDAAQAWFASTGGDPAGAAGHLAIFCIYKSVGVPDGAILLCDPPPVAPTPAEGRVVRLARHQLITEMTSSTRVAGLAQRLAADERDTALRDFALGDPTAPPSPATTYLLPRLARADIAAHRRRNYRTLLDRLGDLVPAPFNTLPVDAAPLFVPVVPATGEKAELLAQTADRGVAGLNFWSVPHPELPANRFPGAAKRRRSVVGLPVHQELRPGDLDRMVAAVRGLSFPAAP